VKREPSSLIANSTVLLVSRVVTLVSGGALAIYAIRTLSVEDFGRYSIALALAMILSLLSEMGISSLAVRKIAHKPEQESRVLAVALAAELATSAAAAALLVPVALLLRYPAEVIGLVAIAAVAVLVQGLLTALETPFQARRVLSYVALFGALQGLVTAGVGFPLLALRAGPMGLMAALAVGYATTCVGAVWMLRWAGIRPSWAGATSRIPRFLLAALPIAATGGVTIVYERVDLLLVSKLDTTEGAAVYAVALQALQFAMLLPAVVTASFFPLLTTHLRDDRDLGARSVALLARIFLVLSVPLVIVFVVAAEPLVTFVLGDRYEDAAVPLAIVSGSMVLGFLNYLYWSALLAAFLERAKLKIMAVALSLNVAANLVLIPAYGPTGAAISLLGTDLILGIWQMVVVHRRVFPIPFARIFVTPGIVAAVAIAVGVGVGAVYPVVGALVGVGIFVLVLLRARYVTAEEWRPLTAPLLGLVGRIPGRRQAA
jgi:O-antigen/teichoic acid export membrane protein